MIQIDSVNLSKGVKNFNEFHLDLKNQLDKNSVSPTKEKAFLDDFLVKYSSEYYRLLEYLGNLTLDFTLKQKQQNFHQLSKLGIHDLLKGAPYFYHSIFKPRGYAGDAEMMALIYRNQYEGTTLFEKLMHRMGTECAAGVAIRNRRQLMLNEFKKLGKGKVLSLAAGPAQEIYDAIEIGFDKLNFTALDHDIITLKNAQKKIQSPNLKYAIANAFHLIKENRTIAYPRKLFLNYCMPKKDFKGIQKVFVPIKYNLEKLRSNTYDLIYSIGLFDYIKTYDDPKKGTIQLTKVLFDLLKPGGKLLIGNVSHAMPKGIIWAMNCLCDWYLIHRTEQEVIDFASGIPKEQIGKLEVVTEPSGVNYFLKIEKIK